MKALPLKDVLAYSVGGGWGSDGPIEGRPHPVRVIRGADFPDVRAGNFHDLPNRYETTAIAQSRALREGDLVMESSGGTRDRPTGRIVRITEWVDYAGATTIPASFCKLLRPDLTAIDPKYLYYYLDHWWSSGQSWNFQNQSTGISNLQFRRVLDEVLIPTPPRSLQLAIGEVLGALDDKIAANQLVIRSMLDLGRALVMGTDMTRIPIGQIMTITMGTSPKGDDLNEMTSGVPFFQGVRDFGQIFPKNRIYTTHSIRNAKANDILFAVRAPVGRVNLAVDDVSIGRGIAALACSTAPATLFYALMAQEQLWQIFDGGGTVFASVNRKEIEAMTIRWPKDTPAIETVVKPLLDRSVLAEQENTTLTAVRDELLPELMSGRITVKDAEKRVEEEV